MARIRSIHPGLFTDESFMSASLPARLLLMGIWTEAFDDGVFEWKPITLKARIFPVDSVDVPALLQELAGLNFLQSFEVGGKKYGLVRNFCKYQRPKKPNSSGVLPANLRPYTGSTDDSSEPIPNQSRTNGEKSPQMEDGGEDGEEKESSGGGYCRAPAAAASNSIDLEDLAQRCEKASGLSLGSRKIEVIAGLVAEGISLDERILPVMRDAAAELKAWNKPAPRTWGYFEKPIRDAGRKAKPPDKPVELIFVREGSDLWQQIEGRGGFYRDWLKEKRKLVEGIAGAHVPPYMTSPSTGAGAGE